MAIGGDEVQKTAGEGGRGGIAALGFDHDLAGRVVRRDRHTIARFDVLREPGRASRSGAIGGHGVFIGGERLLREDLQRIAAVGLAADGPAHFEIDVSVVTQAIELIGDQAQVTGIPAGGIGRPGEASGTGKQRRRGLAFLERDHDGSPDRVQVGLAIGIQKAQLHLLPLGRGPGIIGRAANSPQVQLAIGINKDSDHDSEGGGCLG